MWPHRFPFILSDDHTTQITILSWAQLHNLTQHCKTIVLHYGHERRHLDVDVGTKFEEHFHHEEHVLLDTMVDGM